MISHIPLSPAHEQGNVRALQVRRDGGAQELHQVQENIMRICADIKTDQVLNVLKGFIMKIFQGQDVAT